METILIVDDEKNYLVVLETLLGSEGYETIHCESWPRSRVLPMPRPPGSAGRFMRSKVDMNATPRKASREAIIGRSKALSVILP